MNVQYRIEFTDLRGVDWKVDIEGVGSTTILQGAANPLVCQWYGSDDKFEQAIIGSKASINVWVNDFMLTDLYDVGILSRRVVIYHKTAGSYVKYWSGYILPESYEEPYNQSPIQTTITASDGLGLLKEFQFKDLGYTERLKASTIIYDILSEIGITAFTEYINVYESTMGSLVGNSPLDQIGIDPDAYEYDTYYAALESILDMFGAVITQDLGEFTIFKPVEVTSTMYGRRFTSGTGYYAVSKNPDQFINRTGQVSHFKDTEGGMQTMIPKASEYIINYDLGLKTSALKEWDFDFNDFTEVADVWSIPNWDTDADLGFGNAIVITPLSEILKGEDRGVYTEGTGANQHLRQSITKVKNRSPQFRLSFDFKIRNISGADVNRTFSTQMYIVSDAEPAIARFWNAVANEWSEDPLVPNDIFQGVVEPGWSDWINHDMYIHGVPFNCTLIVKLFSASDSTDQTMLAYRDVKLVMTPLQGGSDTGIGYTYTAASAGRLIEKEHRLGDGFDVARHAVNQLISYHGIINFWDGVNIVDPGSTPKWRTRGNTEDMTILELLTSEIGKQYGRPKPIIDLPVWVNDPDAYISQVGNIQDTLNKVGAANRRFLPSISTYHVRDAEYSLNMSEILI